MNKEALLFVEERQAYLAIQKLVKELNSRLYTAVVEKGLNIDVDTVVFKEVQCKHVIHQINVNVYREITDEN